MRGSGEDPIERASVDELRTLQLERLRWSLKHAYENAPHYRRRFDEAGVRPEDLRTLEDFRHFPFTTKEDLRENYPFGLFAVPREQVVRIHASSGTTGRSTVVGYTERDLDDWANLVARSIRAAGGRPGDVVHVAYGYGLFTGGLGAHYGAERLGCTVIPVSGGQTERQVQLIQDLRPDIIMVTPSYMLVIADEMERQGIDPRSTSVRVGIFGAEPWTEAMRAEIESKLGLQALDIYGLSEVMGPGVAQESADCRGALCLWEDYFYPEIIDPETGEVQPDGVIGELVLTSLRKEALPVIRYRTRDITRLMPAVLGPIRRLARITGRTDDMLIIRGVNVFPSQIEELILKVAGFAPHYQLELTRAGRLDELTVRAEAATASLTPDRREAMATELRQLIKSYVGVSVRVAVLEPGAIERSVGKARRVVDRRAQR